MDIRVQTPHTRHHTPRRRELVKSFCALLAIFLFCFSLSMLAHHAWAQAGQGAIDGVVVDVRGVPIPGAGLVAENVTTGAVLRTMSDVSGHFSFLALPIGSYRIAAEKSGFSTSTQQPVEVAAGKQTSLRLEMKVAPAKDDILRIPGYAVNPHEVDDVFFLDSRHGWVVLEDHKRNLYDLLRTDDGGESWTALECPRGLDQTYFVDPLVGWAVRRTKSHGRSIASAYLVRTHDGGTTWQQTTTEPLEAKLAPDEFVVRMAFSDHKAGWFFTSRPGPSGSVLVTRDGGKSVEVSSTPKNNRDYRGIFALPSGRVWILGSEDILATRNLGKTWEQQFDLVDPRLNSVETLLTSASFFPDGRGWVVGQEVDEGIVLATRDFGNHWQRVFESREPPDLKSVYFSDENDGCAVGLFESLLCTRDGGSTWANRKVLPLPKGTQANFFIKIVMLKSGRGFALRAGGFLYETNDGGQTWHEFDPLAAALKK